MLLLLLLLLYQEAAVSAYALGLTKGDPRNPIAACLVVVVVVVVVYYYYFYYYIVIVIVSFTEHLFKFVLINITFSGF